MTYGKSAKKRLLIACEVFRREVEVALERTGAAVESRFLDMGIHGDTTENAHAAIQAQVDAADPAQHDAVLIGYGVCNYGVRGLRSRELPLVIPRHHDCISLLLGSRERYLRLLQDEPNTFFTTPGWVDAAEDGAMQPPNAVTTALGMNQDLDTLIAKYGEENGRYIYDTLKRRPYSRRLHVATGVPGEAELVDRCQDLADDAHCPLAVVVGTTRCLERLLQGQWDDKEFLVTPPGKEVDLATDKRLLCWKEPAR